MNAINTLNTTNTVEKAEQLASKLDKLNAHFDIVESTIVECTDYVQSIEGDIIDEKEILTEPDEFISPADILSMLRNDFLASRTTLLTTIQNGREVITAINSKLTMFEEDSANAELIGAYAALVKTVNDSTKLLIGLYKDIIATHKLLKTTDTKALSGGMNIEGDVTINSISGSISDIIKQIKGTNSVS